MADKVAGYSERMWAQLSAIGVDCLVDCVNEIKCL